MMTFHHDLYDHEDDVYYYDDVSEQEREKLLNLWQKERVTIKGQEMTIFFPSEQS